MYSLLFYVCVYLLFDPQWKFTARCNCMRRVLVRFVCRTIALVLATFSWLTCEFTLQCYCFWESGEDFTFIQTALANSGVLYVLMHVSSYYFYFFIYSVIIIFIYFYHFLIQNISGLLFACICWVE